jgi:hypothetical protein
LRLAVVLVVPDGFDVEAVENDNASLAPGVLPTERA